MNHAVFCVTPRSRCSFMLDTLLRLVVSRNAAIIHFWKPILEPSRTSAVPQTSAQCELSLCVSGIRGSAPGFEQVQERSSREQVELQEAQDLAHGPGHLVDELQVGEQEMHAHGDPRSAS